jgi:SAM-dependent methyltransferase
MISTIPLNISKDFHMQTRLVPINLLFGKVHSDSGHGSNATSTKEVETILPLVNIPFYRQRRYSPFNNIIGNIFCWNAERCNYLPNVVDLNRDRLIVDNGVELACIAKAGGKKWLKVTMPDSVATRWDARSTQTLVEILKKTHRTEFYNPIEHIDYRRAKIARPESDRLDMIYKLIGPLETVRTGLDIGCNMGYISHHLQRHGLRMTSIDYDSRHYAIACALNETYGLDVNFINCQFKEIDYQEPFDIVVSLTVLYHIFFRQEEYNVPLHLRMSHDEVMRKIDRLAKHVLIWESGDSPDIEKKIIISKSGLTQYRSLGFTSGTGKKRELGVFLRPGTTISEYLLNRWQSSFPKQKK